MTRSQKAAKIDRLCNHHDCSDKIRKVHFEQFVERNWHPHPPAVFEEWVRRHPDYKEMISSGISVREATVTMFNSACYYDQFCEMRTHGLLGVAPRPIHAKASHG